jgi:hypothetical protein
MYAQAGRTQSYNALRCCIPSFSITTKYAEASEPILAAGQVGPLMGWGVFSTLRVTNGVLFAFERHWARMKRDGRTAAHSPSLPIPIGFGIGYCGSSKPMTARKRTLRVWHCKK